MRWLTNKGKNEYHPRDYGIPTTTGEPKATEWYSVDELIRMGLIGVYAIE